MSGSHARGATPREVYSWAFYDWANSAFATTVMVGFFPIFFKQYWNQGVSAAESTFRLGVTNSVASIVVVLIAPIIGALADRGGQRKRFLLAFAALGVASTGALYLVQQGFWWLAAMLYALAIIGFSGANVCYDALLVVVSSPRLRDRISALGFALGYLGGGLLFAINVFMTLRPELWGLADAAAAVRWSFVTVALWWAVFSVPLLIYVNEPLPAADRLSGFGIGAACQELAQTFRHVREHRVALRFLIAYWLYIDGVGTIARMAVDYGLALGFEASSLIVALLITQFVGFPASLVFGRLGERFGAKTGILIALATYVGVTAYAYFMDDVAEFYVLAFVIGLVLGGVASLSRSLYSCLIPADKSAEFFGFYNMMGKFAAVVGPLLVGAASLAANDPRLGILSVLIFFVAGAAVLAGVPAASRPE